MNREPGQADGGSAASEERPQFSFILYGPPQPKERARRGKGRRFFTPKRTRLYEAALRERACLYIPRDWCMDGTYRIELKIVFGDFRPRDTDNVTKAVKDALNGIAWQDDNQVFEDHAVKSHDMFAPRTEVTITRVGDFVRPRRSRKKPPPDPTRVPGDGERWKRKAVGKV